MSISAAVVLYAVLWFMFFLIVLPLRLVSQDEAGSVVPGTPRGAPINPAVRQKAWISTGLAAAGWLVLYWVITSGVITMRDIDFMGRMPPEAGQQTTP